MIDGVWPTWWTPLDGVMLAVLFVAIVVTLVLDGLSGRRRR